jgi:hypothetical protein
VFFLPHYDDEGNSLLDPKIVAQTILDTRAAGIKSSSKQNNYIEVVDSNGFATKEGFDLAKTKYVLLKLF